MMDSNGSGVNSFEEDFGLPQFHGFTIAFRWVLLFILCCISYGHMKLSRTGRMLRKFPNLWSVPLIGSFVESPLHAEDFYRKISETVKKKGRLVSFWAGNIPFIMVADADAAQKVLTAHKQIQKGITYRQFEWILGKGLVTANVETWKKDRKRLVPSFKFQRFDGFLEIFNEKSATLVEILDQTYKDKGKDFHMYEYLSRATMDSISETVLGVPTDYQHDITHSFIQALEYVGDAIRMRVTKPYLTLFPAVWNLTKTAKQEQIAVQVITDNTYKTVQRRIAAIKDQQDNSTSIEPKRKTRPIIDYLLDTGSFEFILGHVNTIFGGGFDTTATTMNNILFMLALHPEVQETVYGELESIFWDDFHRPVNMEDLEEMRYLEMVIKETLRIYPAAPIIFRTATEDIPLDENLTIPKGTEMAFPILEIHMDPKHFPNPERFDPDRFLPHAVAQRHRYAWMPFSAGPRNCLGMRYAMMQMKTMITYIVRKFRVTTSMKREDLTFLYGLIMETLPKIEVQLVPRMINNNKEECGVVGDNNLIAF